MKDQIAMVLDKSLKSHGVQLTNKELLPVVNDLMAFLEPKDEPAPAAPVAVEMKPIPVKS